MKVAFWSMEHQSGTTAHMLAVIGMLRILYGKEGLADGRILQSCREKIMFFDCGAGMTMKKQRFLWNADFVVISIKRKQQCIEDFFARDFHITNNRIFLLGGYNWEENVNQSYLTRTYRIEPEQVIWIPYNHAFYQALEHGKSDRFIERELYAPTSLANEEFIQSVWIAATRIVNRTV